MRLKLPINQRFIEEHGAYPDSLQFGGGKKTAVQRKLQHAGVGGFEPAVQAAILTALELSKHQMFYDVGAHVGFYSAILSAIFPQSRGVAFEPTPETYGQCSHLRDVNGFTYDIVNKAVSNKSGVVDFFLSPIAETSNSLNSAFRDGSQRIEVECVTLDSIGLPGSPAPKVIKIDVETHEAEVIAGGLAMIERAKPTIVCEILKETDIALMRESMEKMSAWGYTFHALGPSGVSRRMNVEDVFRSRKRARWRDWMFSPHKVGQRFRDIYSEWIVALADLAAETAQARAEAAALAPEPVAVDGET